MEGGMLVREARKRAGLTQRQLAELVGVAQPTIARIETGVSEPGLDTVRRMLFECGLELDVRLVPSDEATWLTAAANLRLGPEARVRQHGSALRFAEAGRRALAGQRAHG
jgi:transcriptional regulator with XRE-family HTH domain